MKSIVMVAVAAAAFAVAGVASASEDLAKSSGCTTCHATDTKKMGPSFKDIAAKNKGKADAEKKIVAALDSGQGHPKVKSTGAENVTLTKWILGM